MYFNKRYFVFIFLGLVYLFLPTHNANIDSWYYAACVKHNDELWNSHHLLYNGFGRLWYMVCMFFYPNLEALAALNIMNGIAAMLCLFVLHACLLKLNTEKTLAFWLTLLCGSSYGFMRFATDAETYILPLLFSLIATYYFIYFKNWKQLFLAAFFSCLAILFHQLHVWWGLAFVAFLLVQKPMNIKNVLRFSSIFLLVPMVYFIVFKTNYSNITFFQFITGEYSKGNAAIVFNFKNVAFTFVNLGRSFIQIHGYMIDLLKIYALFCIGLIFFLYQIIFELKPWLHIVKQEKNNYTFLFAIAFILHLMFAMLSSANAEFMVMLPFLTVLYLVVKFKFSSIVWLKILVGVLFLWNVSLGLIPHRFLNINKVDKQVEITLKNSNAYFLWHNKPLVENIITYQKGFNFHPNFINKNSKNAQLFLDSLLNKNAIIYTETLSGTDYSRDNFYSSQSQLNGRYYYSPVLKFQSIYGENSIDIISKKGE